MAKGAASLFLERYIRNIYGKLGARSRAEAIVRAAREGMVVIDE